MTGGLADLGGQGVLKPGPLLWLRALLWMAALFIVLAVLAGIEPLARSALHRQAAEPGPVGAALGAVLACIAYVALVRVFERRWPREFALDGLPSDLVVGLALGTGMFALVFFILERLGAEALVWDGSLHWRQSLTLNACTGLVEELLFRAVAFRLLMRAFGAWWALAASAALFGAAHFTNPHATPLAAAAIAVEAGLMLAGLYLATGRLWMSVGVHAAWNFAQGKIFGAAVSGHGQTDSLFLAEPNRLRPDLLTGGDFGPEASLPAMLVGLAVFGAALWIWLRRRALPEARG
jgi:CAAX protease family protein